jgi:hypothetical protein
MPRGGASRWTRAALQGAEVGHTRLSAFHFLFSLFALRSLIWMPIGPTADFI